MFQELLFVVKDPQLKPMKPWLQLLCVSHYIMQTVQKNAMIISTCLIKN
jgi:hypothetical protein